VFKSFRVRVLCSESATMSCTPPRRARVPGEVCWAAKTPAAKGRVSFEESLETTRIDVDFVLIPPFLVACGGFSRVLRVRRRADGLVGCLKVSRTLEKWSNEVATFRQAQGCVHVGLLWDAFVVGQGPMEESALFMPQYLQMPASVGHSGAFALRFLRDVATALAWLWEVGVVHNDVKPRNVCIQDDGSFVLVDFGEAEFVDMMDVKDACSGSSGYTLPGSARCRLSKATAYAIDQHALAVAVLHVESGICYDEAPPSPATTCTCFFELHKLTFAALELSPAQLVLAAARSGSRAGLW